MLSEELGPRRRGMVVNLFVGKYGYIPVGLKDNRYSKIESKEVDGQMKKHDFCKIEHQIDQKIDPKIATLTATNAKSILPHNSHDPCRDDPSIGVNVVHDFISVSKVLSLGIAQTK